MDKKPCTLKDETVDGLLGGRLSVIQRLGGYRFSLDALALAHFVRVGADSRIADLGAGNGVVSLILGFLYSSARVTGLELQIPMVERAGRNVVLNRLGDRVEMLQGDVRFIEKSFTPGSFDVVVSNPPYRRLRSGRVNPDRERYLARHEAGATLSEFLRAGSYLLRRRGRMALVYPATRVADLVAGMRDAELEPKRIRFIHSFVQGPAELLLAEGVKEGRKELDVMAPLVVYAKAKSYTEDMEKIFRGEWRKPDVGDPRSEIGDGE